MLMATANGTRTKKKCRWLFYGPSLGKKTWTQKRYDATSVCKALVGRALSEPNRSLQVKEVLAAEKALNAKSAQLAATAAKGASAEEAAAAAQQLAADEKAQADEDAKSAPTFSVAFICNVKDLTPSSFDERLQRKCVRLLHLPLFSSSYRPHPLVGTSATSQTTSHCRATPS
jgi:hypothetical protein